MSSQTTDLKTKAELRPQLVQTWTILHGDDDKWREFVVTLDMMYENGERLLSSITEKPRGYLIKVYAVITK